MYELPLEEADQDGVVGPRGDDGVDVGGDEVRRAEDPLHYEVGYHGVAARR